MTPKVLGFLKRVLGDSPEKEFDRMRPIVEEINEIEIEIEELSDAQLRDKTTEFRGRYLAGEPLDDLLPEAFAVVREAARRTIGQRHFDVQLMGGIILHEGRIAEMKTEIGRAHV